MTQDPLKPQTPDEISLEDFEEQVRAQAGIRPDVWKGMMAQESAGGRKTVSPTGVRGRWQVTESVAKQYGLDRNNPFHQATAAAKYLKEQYDGLKDVKNDDERWLGAVARYYGGPDAVGKDGTVSNVSRDGYSTPAVHIQRVAEKMAEATRLTPPVASGRAPAPTQQQPRTATTVSPQRKQVSSPNPFSFNQPISETLANDASKREVLATGRDGRPLPSPAPRKTPSRYRGLRDMVDNEDGQSLPEPTAEDRARAEFRQKSLPAQIYEEAQAIPSRLVTAAAAPLQRINVIGEGLRNADPEPLIATAGELAAGAVKGYHDIAKNTGKVLPESLGGYIMRQVLPSRADAQQVGERAKAVYEAGANRYSYNDPILPSFNELRGRQLQEEYEASLRPGMAAGVTRAVGGALPAVAAGGVGGIPAALATQAALGDVEKPLDTAVNMASVAVPMKLTAAARPALNAATQSMATIPRTLSRLGGEMAVGGAGNVGQELVTQPLLTGTIDPQKLVESGVVGSLFGINDVVQQGLANRAAARRAPVQPVQPRTVDTNLTPDEAMTPATGAPAAPVIDPVTGLPNPAAVTPEQTAAQSQIDNMFGLGRKPNPAAEKAAARAQEASTFRQAADEAAAAGDVPRQVDALQEALKLEVDPQAKLDIKAQLRGLKVQAPGTEVLTPGIAKPPSLEVPTTETLPQDLADLPTADLPQPQSQSQPVVSPNEPLVSASERRAVAEQAGNWRQADEIAVGELAGLKLAQKEAKDLASQIQFATAIRALQNKIKDYGVALKQQEAAAKPAPVRTPKAPKIVTPKVESVRKRQGVLKGVAPDQTDLVDNPNAIVNPEGGIPPVEPIAKAALSFEELARQQRKGKGERLDNVGIAARIQQLGGIEPSGEARRNGAKYPGLVRQGGLSPDVLAVDLAAEGYPVDPDNLDTLYEALDRAAAGQDVYPLTKSRTADLQAEENARYGQMAADESAPIGSTRLPSGLLGQPRRPVPVETAQNTQTVKQQAIERVQASDLPDSMKQRLLARIPEQDDAYAQSVLDDPDIQPVPQRKPAEQVQEVELRRTGTDNAPGIEMPKRATPPKPIPDDIKRVYGEKVTSEQAEAIQRRIVARESVEIGLGGKFGDMARKSFMSSDGQRELPTLVEHPALREALGLPEMPAYLVEDGRVSKLWQDAAQHTLDGLAEWAGVERSSRAGDDGLMRLEDAIAERIGDPDVHEAFLRTVVATETAQKRLDAVLSQPEVKAAIEAAQAEIADQQARGLKSIALRKTGKALDTALENAAEQALKDFPADAIGSYGKDWSQITKNAIEEFRADLRAERLGPDGSPESWIGRRFRQGRDGSDVAEARQGADAPREQSAASPAESPSGRAPAQEGATLRAEEVAPEYKTGMLIERKRDGRIYEITKYDPREGEVKIKQPDSPMGISITKDELLKSYGIPAAQAEIGETQSETGQSRQDLPQTPGREETPEIKDNPSEIGEGVRRAAEAAKRKLRKPQSQDIKPEIVTKLDGIAEEAKQRLSKRGRGRLASGIDPADLADYAVIGAARVAKGAVQFGDWSAQMVKQFGEAIKPHLKDIWTSAHDYIGALKEYRRGEDPIATLRARYFDKALAQSKVRTADGDIAAVYHGTQSPVEIKKLDSAKFDKAALYGPGFYTTQSADIAAGDEGYAMSKPYTPSKQSLEAHPEFPNAVQQVIKDWTMYPELAEAYRQDSPVTIEGNYYKSARSFVQEQARAEIRFNHLTAAPHAYEFYLDIRNPFDVDKVLSKRDAAGLLREAGASDTHWKSLLDKIESDHTSRIGNVLYSNLVSVAGSEAKANNVLVKAGYDGITHIGGFGDSKHRVWIAFKPEQVYSAHADIAPRATNALRKSSGSESRQPTPGELGTQEGRGERGAIINPFAKSSKPEITKRDLKGSKGQRYAEVRLGEQKFEIDTEDAQGQKLHADDASVIREAQKQFNQEAAQALGAISANQATRTEVRNQAITLGRQIQAATQRGDWIVASRLNKKLQGIKGATTFDVQRFANQAKALLGKKLVKPDTEKAILAAAQEVATGVQNGDQKAIERGRLKLLEIQDDLKAEMNMKPTGKDVTDKVATVHAITQLLAPVTAMRNILSNAAYAVGRNIDIAVASGIDKGISKVTGERTVLTPRRGQIADLKAEMKRAWNEIDKGNLNVMRESQFGLADHHVLESKIGKFFEKALSKSLKVPDAGFFHAAYRESVRNQIEAQQQSQRPTQTLEQIHDRAVNEALQSVFADSNALSRAAVWAKDKANLGKAWGVADVMGLRYPKVPANLLARALEHSPAGLIRELYNLSQVGQGKAGFDQRRTSVNIAKSLTGTLGAATAGYLLTALGIIVREPDSDDSYGEQALQMSTGLPRYGINLSAAKRYATGGIIDFITKADTSAGKLLRGDKLADFGWLQPHGMMLGIGSAVYDDRAQGKKASVIEAIVDSLDSATEVLSDQSILKLGRDFMRDVTKEGGGWATAAENMAYKGIVNLPASFVPGALSSVRQMTDNTWRDTRPEQPGKTTGQKARAMAEETVKRAGARIPLASGRLPVRPDVTGEPRQSPQDKFANPQVMVNPARFSEFAPNDYTEALIRLKMGASYTPRFVSRTDALPEPTSALREREIERGRLEMQKGNQLVNSPAFKQADPERQKEMIQAMRRHVTESLGNRRKSAGYPYVDKQSKEGKRATTARP